MKKFRSPALAIIGAIASLTLVASSAVADTSTIYDGVGDVLQDHYPELPTVGFYDGDLTHAIVDYGQDTLTVTTFFADLNDLSIEHLFVAIDANGDRSSDYVMVLDNGATLPTTFAYNSKALTSIGNPSLDYQYGSGGFYKMSIPSLAIGKPPHMTVQLLASFQSLGDTYYNLDAMPTTLDGAVSWSQPIAITKVATITNTPKPTVKPKPKAAATKTTIKLSKKSQKFKSKSVAKLTVRVSAKIKGRAVVFDGKKKLRTLPVRNGVATFKLPRTLKPGTHKLRVKLTPADRSAHLPSTSKTVKLKVSK